MHATQQHSSRQTICRTSQSSPLKAAKSVAILLSFIFLGTEVPHSETSPYTMLVAPLYIVNDSCTSLLTLANLSRTGVEIVASFNSLEGEEVARRVVMLKPHSKTKIAVDTVQMTKHRFPSLGSIKLSLKRRDLGKIRAQVTIHSRAQREGFSMEEHFQPAEQRHLVNVALLPESFSVPVVALHNRGSLNQSVSLRCVDAQGAHFESSFSLPSRTTVLMNACITRRAESRTYLQMLSGDVGPSRGPATITVTTSDPQAGVAVWGFAADTRVEVGRVPVISGLEFSEREPEGESLKRRE